MNRESQKKVVQQWITKEKGKIKEIEQEISPEKGMMQQQESRRIMEIGQGSREAEKQKSTSNEVQTPGNTTKEVKS